MAFNPLQDWVFLTGLFVESQKNYRVRAKNQLGAVSASLSPAVVTSGSLGTCYSPTVKHPP